MNNLKKAEDFEAGILTESFINFLKSDKKIIFLLKYMNYIKII